MAKAKVKQTHIRCINGRYYVQLKDTRGKRHTLTLDTDDRPTAEARVGQALQQLRKRLRQEDIDASPRFRPTDMLQVWDVESDTYTEEPAIGNVPDEILDSDEDITWRDITTAVRERQLRLKGRDLSASWYKALRLSVEAAEGLGLKPKDMATPTNCLALVRSLERSGLGRATITSRLSTMVSALNGARKAGIYPDLRNAFGDIDFRSTAGQVHHPTPTADQLTLVLQKIQDLPRHHRLAFELLLATGGRVGAVTSTTLGDLRDEGVELKGKGKESYWVPLPAELYAELKGDMPRFVSPARLRVVLEGICPGLVPHSFRHLFATVGRRVGVPLDAQARLMNHSIPASMTQTVYGEWPRERLRMEASKIWKSLAAHSRQTA